MLQLSLQVNRSNMQVNSFFQLIAILLGKRHRDTKKINNSIDFFRDFVDSLVCLSVCLLHCSLKVLYECHSTARHWVPHSIFTTRLYVMQHAVLLRHFLSVRLSVCLSVCLSNAWILTKRKHLYPHSYTT